MIVAGAWFAHLAPPRQAVLIPTALLGVGTLGVGVFPLTRPTPHTLFAFTPTDARNPAGTGGR